MIHHLIARVILVLAVVGPTTALASDVAKLRVALLGDPNTVPQWTDEQVQGLVDAGFNAVQLNVAWGARPANEPLNLNDVVGLPGEELDSVVAKRQPELRKRIDLAKKHGLRTIFHFGSPFMWRDPDTGEIKRHKPDAHQGIWFDSANPKVVEYETGLLKE